MTAAAALPAAAERTVRSASGRRALRTCLFVGVLFALGLLFGGRAEAAEPTAVQTTARTQTAAAEPTAVQTTAAEPTAVDGPSASEAVTSLTGRTATAPSDRTALSGRTVTAPSGLPAPTGRVSGATTDGAAPTGTYADDATADGTRAIPATTAAPAHTAAPATPATTAAPATAGSLALPTRTHGAAAETALTATSSRASAPATSTGTFGTASAATSRATGRAVSAAGAAARPVTDAVVVPVAEAVVRPVTAEVVRAVGNPLGVLAQEAARRLPETPFAGPALPGLGGIGADRGGPQSGGDLTGPRTDGEKSRNNNQNNDRKNQNSRKNQGPRSASVCSLPGQGAGALAVTAHHAHDVVGDGHQPLPLPYDAPLGPGPHGIAAQHASDSSAQRHGELHATTAAGEPVFVLAAGDGAAAAHWPTRDRHRDILEFPG